MDSKGLESGYVGKTVRYAPESNDSNYPVGRGSVELSLILTVEELSGTDHRHLRSIFFSAAIPSDVTVPEQTEGFESVTRGLEDDWSELH